MDDDMGAGRRVLVTGSRGWSDRATVAGALATVARKWPLATLVHGACPTGTDALADEWWRTFGGNIEQHPADWSQGRSAGPTRNAYMVNLGADLCLAFIGSCSSPRCGRPYKHPSHGATGCVELAERAGIPTRRFTP